MTTTTTDTIDIAGLDGGPVSLDHQAGRRAGLAGPGPAAPTWRPGVERCRCDLEWHGGQAPCPGPPAGLGSRRRRRGRVRPRARAAAQHQGRGPQHRRNLHGAGRPDPRPVPPARSHRRPRGQARPRRPGLSARGGRPGHPGPRAGHRARLCVRDWCGRPDPGRWFWLSGPPLRLDGRQPHRGRDRHRRWPGPNCQPRPAPRAVLGPPGWWRQLRGRHPVQLPPARGRPDDHRRPDHLERGAGHRGAGRLPRPHRTGAAGVDRRGDRAAGAAGSVPAPGLARQAHRRDPGMPQRRQRRRRPGRGSRARGPDRGPGHPQAVCGRAVDAECHGAQVAAPLLEGRVLPWPVKRVPGRLP